MPRKTLWKDMNRLVKKAGGKKTKHTKDKCHFRMKAISFCTSHLAANLHLPLFSPFPRFYSLVNFLWKRILPLISGECSKSVQGQGVNPDWFFHAAWLPLSQSGAPTVPSFQMLVVRVLLLDSPLLWFDNKWHIIEAPDRATLPLQFQDYRLRDSVWFRHVIWCINKRQKEWIHK